MLQEHINSENTVVDPLEDEAASANTIYITNFKAKANTVNAHNEEWILIKIKHAKKKRSQERHRPKVEGVGIKPQAKREILLC